MRRVDPALMEFGLPRRELARVGILPLVFVDDQPARRPTLGQEPLDRRGIGAPAQDFASRRLSIPPGAR